MLSVKCCGACAHTVCPTAAHLAHAINHDAHNRVALGRNVPGWGSRSEIGRLWEIRCTAAARKHRLRGVGSRQPAAAVCQQQPAPPLQMHRRQVFLYPSSPLSVFKHPPLLAALQPQLPPARAPHDAALARDNGAARRAQARAADRHAAVVREKHDYIPGGGDLQVVFDGVQGGEVIAGLGGFQRRLRSAAHPSPQPRTCPTMAAAASSAAAVAPMGVCRCCCGACRYWRRSARCTRCAAPLPARRRPPAAAAAAGHWRTLSGVPGDSGRLPPATMGLTAVLGGAGKQSELSCDRSVGAGRRPTCCIAKQLRSRPVALRRKTARCARATI